MIQFTRFAASVGIVAGSLAVAAPALADIPITGGQVSGDAAFITPLTPNTFNRTGSPVLFDTVIQTLRIVTPNGTTTTSRFIPISSDFTDANGNSRPDSGDRGRLEGALSGVAFSRVGSPVFFQNIPTALNFTLTAFTSNSFGIGSLISPNQKGTAPLVFIPGAASVVLSNASSSVYSSKPGLLEVGPFAANLTGDFIGLPSDLQLRPSSTDVTLVPVFLGRRIKFDFEGKNDSVDEAAYRNDLATGRRVLNFAGDVTEFKIESVGNSNSQFKIEGSGKLDISLTGPFDIKKDSLNLNTLTGKVNYQIKGEGPGFVAFTGGNSITYSGTSQRDTEFKFEQGDRSFDGKSGGDTFFRVSDRRDNIDFTKFNWFGVVPVVGVSTTSLGAAVIAPSSTTSTTSSTTTTTTSSTTVFSTTVFNSSSITIFPGYRNLLVETRGDGDDDDDDDDDNGNRGRRVERNRNSGDDDDDDNGNRGRRVERNRNSGDDDDDDNDDDDDRKYGRNTSYYVYQQKGASEIVVERQGDRILLVDRTEVRGRKLKQRGKVVGAYQVVGLPSRVFPGMTGLRQIPTDTVQSSSTETEPTAPAALESAENPATATPSVEPAGNSSDSGNGTGTAIAP